jgi:SRSO17 transposase
MDRAELRALRSDLDTFLGEFKDCFARRRTADHLGVYVRGQLGPLPRKSVEPIALEADVPPRTLQEFFSIHSWSAEDMGTCVRRIVARDHADAGAIGILDETSFAKKGDKTAGVQRQYCGATGKIDNCVVSVHLGYAARDFHALVDADLYLPKSWLEDAERRGRAGVPEDAKFRTKWQIALGLIDRTRADGVPLKWITADEGYGEVPEFLHGLADRDLLYMIEVPCSTGGWTVRGLTWGKKHRRVEALWEKGGPPWTTYRIKDTSRGPLVWRARATRFHPSWDPSQELWLVVAHNFLTGEIKYFLSNAPEDTDVALLLTVAFSRWRVERLFEDAKQEVGFDHFELRKFSAVQRHFAASMVSLLFLNRVRWSRGAEDSIANAVATQASDRNSTRPDAAVDGSRSEARAPQSARRVRAAVSGEGKAVAHKGDAAAAPRTRSRSSRRTALPPVDLAPDLAL